MTHARVARLGLAGAVIAAALAGATPARAQTIAAAPPAAQRSADGEDAVARGRSVDDRLEEIRQRIQAALVYPPIARRLQLTGVATLRFSIDAHGGARDVELARSSGHAILDQAARRTLGRAGRLPWIYGRIEVPVRFSLEDPT